MSQKGRFEEARSWYERAAAEKKRGDVEGLVDHDSIGDSLHRVGDCLSQKGRFEEARSWYERAADEKKLGDIDGRIDRDSLDLTLQTIAALPKCP